MKCGKNRLGNKNCIRVLHFSRNCDIINTIKYYRKSRIRYNLLFSVYLTRLSWRKERTEKHMAQKKNTVQIVKELTEPVITGLGYRIWDIEYSKIGTELHLEITIDSDDGINIEDCEKVHRAIEPIIDEADPIEDFYYLDVSSPGLERNIRTPEHFDKCVGQTVEVKLFSAFEGKKKIVGELISYNESDDSVTIKDKGGAVYTLSRKLISKANVYFEM